MGGVTLELLFNNDDFSECFFQVFLRSHQTIRQKYTL